MEFKDRRLESVNVSGLSAEWVEVNGGDVYPGRTFTRFEDLSNSSVAVINRKLEDQLFRGRDPIGQTIHIAGSPFVIIGVYAQPPSLFSGAAPPFVGIPHGAFVKSVPYFKGWMRLAVAPSPGYTQQESMDEVVATYPKTRLEVILDNLNTHKKNEEWLARHPLVTFHYTPTRASWLNQVECWFSILQGQSLTGASFTSVEQLKKHIDAFIESYNEDAEPFVWTKSKVHQRRVSGRRLSDL